MRFGDENSQTDVASTEIAPNNTSACCATNICKYSKLHTVFSSFHPSSSVLILRSRTDRETKDKGKRCEEHNTIHIHASSIPCVPHDARPVHTPSMPDDPKTSHPRRRASVSLWGWSASSNNPTKAKHKRTQPQRTSIQMCSSATCCACKCLTSLCKSACALTTAIVCCPCRVLCGKDSD